MLDLMGRGYVLEHCGMCLRKEQEMKALRIYVTDALKTIADNTSRLGSGGVTLKSRYVEWAEQLKAPKEPKESSETIINRIKGRISALGEDDK